MDFNPDLPYTVVQGGPPRSRQPVERFNPTEEPDLTPEEEAQRLEDRRIEEERQQQERQDFEENQRRTPPREQFPRQGPRAEEPPARQAFAQAGFDPESPFEIMSPNPVQRVEFDPTQPFQLVQAGTASGAQPSAPVPQPGSPTDPASQPSGNVMGSLKRGTADAQANVMTTMFSAGQISPEATADLIMKAQLAQQLNPKTPAVAQGDLDWQKVQGVGDALSHILSNPQWTASKALESLPQSAPSAAFGAAGGLAGGWGAIPGVGLGSAVVEYGSSYREFIEKRANPKTRDEWIAALKDNALTDEAHWWALKRAGAVGSADMLGAYLGGKFASKVIEKATGPVGKVLGIGGGIGISGLTESGGEAAGQLATTGTLNIPEVVLEGVIGGAVGGPIEVAAGMYAHKTTEKGKPGVPPTEEQLAKLAGAMEGLPPPPASIVGATVTIGDQTFSGPTHPGALQSASEYLGVPVEKLAEQAVEGYVTNTGLVVDRATALSIAQDAEQLRARAAEGAGELDTRMLNQEYAPPTAMIPRNVNYTEVPRQSRDVSPVEPRRDFDTVPAAAPRRDLLIEDAAQPGVDFIGRATVQEGYESTGRPFGILRDVQSDAGHPATAELRRRMQETRGEIVNALNEANAAKGRGEAAQAGGRSGVAVGEFQAATEAVARADTARQTYEGHAAAWESAITGEPDSHSIGRTIEGVINWAQDNGYRRLAIAQEGTKVGGYDSETLIKALKSWAKSEGVAIGQVEFVEPTGEVKSATFVQVPPRPRTNIIQGVKGAEARRPREYRTPEKQQFEIKNQTLPRGGPMGPRRTRLVRYSLEAAKGIIAVAKSIGVRIPITVNIVWDEAGTTIDLGRGGLDAYGNGFITLNAAMFKSAADAFDRAAHELGHVMFQSRYAATEPGLKQAIRAAYDKWRTENRIRADTTIYQFIVKRNSALSVYYNEHDATSLARDLDGGLDYWLGYEEWVAEQVARWATTDEKPLTAVEKFLASLAKSIVDIGRRVAETFGLPAESFRAEPAVARWLDSFATDAAPNIPDIQLEEQVRSTKENQRNLPSDIEARPRQPDIQVLVDGTDRLFKGMEEAQPEGMWKEEGESGGGMEAKRPRLPPGRASMSAIHLLYAAIDDKALANGKTYDKLREDYKKVHGVYPKPGSVDMLHYLLSLSPQEFAAAVSSLSLRAQAFYHKAQQDALNKMATPQQAGPQQAGPAPAGPVTAPPWVAQPIGQPVIQPVTPTTGTAPPRRPPPQPPAGPPTQPPTGKRKPQSLKQTIAYADRWSWWYKHLLSIPQIARLNPNMKELQNVSQLLRWQEQDRTTLQDDAMVTQQMWRNLGQGRADILVDFMDAYDQMEYLSPTERAAGVERLPTQAELVALAQKYKMDADQLAVFNNAVGDYGHSLGLIESLEKFMLKYIHDPIQQHLMEVAITDKYARMRQRPYMPHMRFGDYAVVVYDQVGEVKYREHVQTLKEAQQIRDLINHQIGKQFYAGPTVSQKFLTAATSGAQPQVPWSFGDEAFVRVVDKTAKPFMGMPPGLLDRVAEHLTLNKAQAEQLNELKYIYNSPRSFVHRFRKRANIPGYSMDFMRAHAQYFWSFGNYYARVKYAREIDAQIRTLYRTADFMPDQSAVPRQRIANFLSETMQEFRDTRSDWTILRSLAFTWFIGGVPSTATLNLSQISTGAYPYLASIYGDVASAKSILSSLTKFGKWWKFDPKAMPTGELSRLMHEAQGAGVIDGVLAHELAGLADSSALKRWYGGNDVQRGLHFIQEAMAWMFHSTEKINRITTFLSAYELAVKGIPKSYQDLLRKRHSLQYDSLRQRNWTSQEALRYLAAVDAVDVTQYLFSRWARPRLFRGRLGNLFIFKSFMQNTLFNLWTLPGLRTRYLLMSAFIGGLLGIPGMEDMEEIAEFLARRLFGKDFNLREFTRRTVTEQLDGPGWASDVLLHGSSRYGYGIPAALDMTGRAIGFDGIPFPVVDRSRARSLGKVSPFPLEELFGVEAEKDYGKATAKAFQRAGGVLFGMGLNDYMAMINAQNERDDLKRWVRLFPRTFNNIARAYRVYRDDGEKTRSGAKLVPGWSPRTDTEHFLEALAIAAGYNPTASSREWDRIRMTQWMDTVWDVRRKGLLAQYTESQRSQDSGEARDVRAAIAKYNKDVDGIAESARPKFYITDDTLKRSFQARERSRVQQENREVPGFSRSIQQLFENRAQGRVVEEKSVTVPKRPRRTYEPIRE